jgi:hypothetical protein
MRKIAITGLKKAAQSVGNYLARKSLRPIARANRAADKATAAIIRGAKKVGGVVKNAERNFSGEYGKAVRNASAAVIKKTRHARPMPRETIGQINRRKGLVDKKYYPSPRNERMRNNINFRDESVRPNRGGDHMSNTRPPRGQHMREYGANADDQVYQGYKKGSAFDFSKLSYDEIKPMGRGPRYSDKQVRAGRRVLGGAAAVGGAMEGYNYYQRQKKSSR